MGELVFDVIGPDAKHFVQNPGFRTLIDCLEYEIGGAERDRTADLLVANSGYGIRWRNTRRHGVRVWPRLYRGFRSSERY